MDHLMGESPVPLLGDMGVAMAFAIPLAVEFRDRCFWRELPASPKGSLPAREEMPPETRPVPSPWSELLLRFPRTLETSRDWGPTFCTASPSWIGFNSRAVRRHGTVAMFVGAADLGAAGSSLGCNVANDQVSCKREGFGTSFALQAHE